MDPNDHESKTPSYEVVNTTTKKRKHVPNLPLFPRVNVKIEPIILEDIVGESSTKKKGIGKKTLESIKNKKQNKRNPYSDKVVSTKGIFSEGFKSELNVDSARGTDGSLPSKSFTKTTRGSTKGKQENTQAGNITLIDETKELANIIQQYGEFFPVALPLTTKLNTIIHENDVEEDDKSFVHTATPNPINSLNGSDAFSLFSDSSNQIPSNGNYFLFQLPASYSSVTNKNTTPSVGDGDGDEDAPNQEINSQDDFDFNGQNIDNPYFTNANESSQGYLEITESGKVRLQVDNETYDVDDAMKSCFLQEIYVTEKDPSIDEDPILAKIGRVSNKFVCSWHIENNNDY